MISYQKKTFDIFCNKYKYIFNLNKHKMQLLKYYINI